MRSISAGCDGNMENKTSGGGAGYSAPAPIPHEPLTAKRSGAVLLTGGICLAAAATALFYPLAWRILSFLCPFCFMNELFGIRCPLCGGTRCVAALVRLDFAEALYYNPLVIAALIVLAYFYIRLAASCFTKPYRRYSPKIPLWGWWAALSIYLLFMLVRNLPFYRAVLY